MTELLPCPFCGAPIEIVTDKYGTWGTLEHKPDCLWYFSNFPKHVIREQDFEKWNTRYERTGKVVRYDAGGGAIWLTCSECGNIMSEHDNYCSVCGARVMRDE